MKVIKELHGGAIIIMTTCYKITKTELYHKQDGDLEVDTWRKDIAEKSKLFSYDLVCNYEEILEKKRLINTPKGVKKIYVHVMPYFRLTQLGFDIMDFANSLNEGKKGFNQQF